MHTWPPVTRIAWNDAKARFHATGTKESVKDKVNGMRWALKKAKEANNKERLVGSSRPSPSGRRRWPTCRINWGFGIVKARTIWNNERIEKIRCY